MPPTEPHRIRVMLDQLKPDTMSWNDLAREMNMTPANVHKLRDPAGYRFTTLTRLCEILECQPGDLLKYVPAGEDVD